MRCKNCGYEINDGEKVCKNCGNKIQQSETIHNQKETTRFLPSFILGLVASLFGISGGLCTTMCNSLYSSGISPLLLIFGGSIVGLIGACKCLSNVKIGSIIELIAAVMMIICLYGITGGDVASVVSMLLFLVSGIIGIIYLYIVKKK